MLLNEAASPAAAAVPVAELAAHLRLGHGFADDGAEDALLELYLRNAVAAVEARTGQALIARDYLLRVSRWNLSGHLTLPVGPVAAVDAIRFVGADGTVSLEAGRWELQPGRVRQRLTGRRGLPLPPVPTGSIAELEFTAGHGTSWPDVPDDLRQAVLMLAAHYHENRHGDGPSGRDLPPAVAAALAPHRPVRI